VILSYAAGIAYALRALFRPKVLDDGSVGYVLFVSLLGLGWFSYYQSRSQDLTFLSVMYPSIILLGIFCFKLVRNLKFKKPETPQITFGFLMILLLVSSAISVGIVFIPTRTNEAELARQKEFFNLTDYIQTLNFKDKNAIIISEVSGILHLASKTRSPVVIPGPTELLLDADFNRLNDYLVSAADRKEDLLVVIDKEAQAYRSTLLFSKTRNTLETRYRIVKTSPDGRLMVFTPSSVAKSD
jgi:hypothetical protein